MKITTIVLASVPALFIQTTKADTAFDGSWWVTLDAKSFDNPDGSKAQPWVIQFPATVKNGVFHGQYGIKGKPFWYELNGQIEAGSATLRADELMGEQKYNFTLSKKAPPGKGHSYSYQVVAHFDSRRGTGRSTDARTRIFTFVKN
jgi:hypothetical protein